MNSLQVITVSAGVTFSKSATISDTYSFTLEKGTMGHVYFRPKYMKIKGKNQSVTHEGH